MRTFGPQEGRSQEHLGLGRANHARLGAKRPEQATPDLWRATAPTRFAYDFSRIPMHAPAAGMVARKLAVAASGDTREREADAVSEQVMRTPETQSPLACACGASCAGCQRESDGGRGQLQTMRVGATEHGSIEAPPIVDEVLRSPGQPLDRAARAFMEPRFGYDFSHIRVHTDSRAEESARAVNALAYSVGHHLVFGAGTYQPATHPGRSLLAHELTHTIQQGLGAFPLQLARTPVDDPAILAENADDVANKLLQLMDMLNPVARAEVIGYKTIALGLVRRGTFRTLVYTVNRNSTVWGLEAAANKLGIDRLTPGVDVEAARGLSGAAIGAPSGSWCWGPLTGSTSKSWRSRAPCVSSANSSCRLTEGAACWWSK